MIAEKFENVIWRKSQIECKKAIKENYDRGITKQLIVKATGAGKRLSSIWLMNNFQRSLFVAHREELIIQAYDEIQRFFPMQVGIIKGKTFEPEKKIVVASVQTLYNHLDKIDPNTFDYIVIDECHHYASRTFIQVVRHFNCKLRTGWTATPSRLDGLSLSNLFQEITYEYPINQGIKDGVLCPIEAYQIKTQTDISKIEKTAGDFNNKQLSEKVDSPLRNTLIVGKYLEYAKGMQGIAFCVDMDHAYHLRDIFREHGISCEAVVSNEKRCPNRQEIIEKFKTGQIDVLTNVLILTEGFDYNDVGIVMMARPTQSETVYVQGIGRVTRIKSESFFEKFNTRKGLILDFVDNTGKHSLINSYELDKGKKIEDRIFLSDEDKAKLIAAREEREKKHRMIEVQYGQDKVIDLLQLPKFRVWNSAKMEEPATEKQIAWLKSIGVWQEDMEYTKAMASELISGQPAKSWQIKKLIDWGYDTSGHVTYGQFQIVQRKIESENKYKFT